MCLNITALRLRLLRYGRLSSSHPIVVPSQYQQRKKKEQGRLCYVFVGAFPTWLQARLVDARTQRIQAEHDAAEEAQHAARLTTQRERSLEVQLALDRQVRAMRTRACIP